jgi:hypothetical protein
MNHSINQAAKPSQAKTPSTRARWYVKLPTNHAQLSEQQKVQSNKRYTTASNNRPVRVSGQSWHTHWKPHSYNITRLKLIAMLSYPRDSKGLVDECGNIVGNRHAATAQRGPSGKRETWADQQRFSVREIYHGPEELIREIFMSMTFD